MNISITVTVAMGLESVLKRELQGLGYRDFQVDNGKITFMGDWIDICRCNIQLRTAGRVYINVGCFEAKTFDELFAKTTEIPWEQWIQETDRFPVAKVSSKNSVLFSKSDSQSIVKKAIVKRLQQSHHINHFPESGALLPIRLDIQNDQVTLSIDSSGEGLHKRGYREHGSPAPLRETLAAALVLLSRWRPDDEILLDPFCGSATILIEAALIAHRKAPGLNVTAK